MAAQQPLTESERESEAIQGVLFKLSARIGAVVFVGVWAVALNAGAEPLLALIRASLALLALTGCGWLAEQFVRTQRLPEPEAAPGTPEQPANAPAAGSDGAEERAA